MKRTNKNMNEVNCSTWSKLMEISATNINTVQDAIDAINSYTDMYIDDDYNEEEMIELVESQFIEVCNDGIIIWMEMVTKIK